MAEDPPAAKRVRIEQSAPKNAKPFLRLALLLMPEFHKAHFFRLAGNPWSIDRCRCRCRRRRCRFLFYFILFYFYFIFLHTAWHLPTHSICCCVNLSINNI